MVESYVSPDVVDFRNHPVWNQLGSPEFDQVLSRIAKKLAEPFPHGYGWAPPALDKLLIKFKRFFYLKLTSGWKYVVPTIDVDVVWHFLMQVPQFYYDFCMKAVGYIPEHHFDYGLGSEDDRKEAEAGARKYHTVYQQIFGEPLEALSLPIKVVGEYIENVKITCGDGRLIEIKPSELGGISSFVIDLG